MTEAADVPSRDVILRLFRKGHRDWPSFLSDSGPAAEKAFFALSDDKRHQAVERQEDYVAALRASKGKICTYAVYLKEERWAKLGDRAVKVDGPKMAAPFGKLWMGARLADLLRSPYGQIADFTEFDRQTIAKLEHVLSGLTAAEPLTKSEQRILDSGFYPADFIKREKVMRSGWPLANTLLERARESKAYPCDPELLPIVSDFHQVKGDTRLFQAWGDAHAERGWPFLNGMRLPDWGVYFPATADDADDIDEAVATALAAYERALKRIRGDEHAA